LRRDELIIDDGVSSVGVLAEARHFNVLAVVSQLSTISNQHRFSAGPTKQTATEEGKTVEDKLTWEDIGGLSGVKKELQQVFYLTCL